MRVDHARVLSMMFQITSLDQNGIVPLSNGGMENSTFPSFASSLAPPPGSSPKRKLTLTTAVLLQVEGRTIAKCLAYIHGRDTKLLQQLSSGEIALLLLDPARVEGRASVALNGVYGSEDRPHWLTRTVLNSLLDLAE